MQTGQISQKEEKQTKELVVLNRSGIHARVSTMIAQRCRGFVSEVRLRNGNAVADCRSVLDLLSLGASNGTTLLLEAIGEDSSEVIEAISALFAVRFNEDEESTAPPPK